MANETFIRRCRALLAKKGKPSDSVYIMGYLGVTGVRQYSDDKVKVAGATVLGMDVFEVTVFYEIEGGRIIANPCIMVEDRKIIRMNGDWFRIKEHVEELTKHL